MTVQEWLGNNQLGIDIWEKKYRQNKESFDEWLDRVSGGNEDIKALIKEKKFLFGGRILSNRGLHKDGVKVTYSNCYVISPPEDSIESIFDCASKLARTFSYGGGCGVDISNLAPRGAKVNNTAKETSGAVSFMDLYSTVTGLIGQNGRRGALMLSISCEHPDLEEFIEVKSDLNRITKANISIRLTDEFMRAVDEDKEYTLRFTRLASGESIEKTINARQLFMKIAQMNWDYAEPGALFWDRIESHNLLSETKEFKYAGTNPCLVGDTVIQTTEGGKRIKDLVGKTPYVYCMGNDGELTIRQAEKVWMTRKNAKVVTVNTHKGSIKCTPDHQIYTSTRGWVCAKDLRHGDKIVGLNRSMKDESHVAVALSGGKYIPEHRFVAGYFLDIEDMDVHHIDGDTLNNRFSNLQVLKHHDHSALTNTGRTIEVKRDCLGRYVKKEIRSKRNSINQGKRVGVNWFVSSVEFNDEFEDVFDMTVPEIHNFIANDMVVHNCAEEPLPAGGSCLLGSLNLAEFVTDKDFDGTAFADAVEASVVALNEVLDEGLPLHPLEEQKASVRDWRQIGLGVMGIADMLIKMGIRYGSPESISICDAIGQRMVLSAIEASCELAKKYGHYPKCNPEEIVQTEFFKAHVHSDKMREDVLKYGLRNSQLLTIAPTGTLSTMLGVSGGIEPIFANFYERKTESLHGKDVYYKVYTPIVRDYMDANGISDDSQLPSFFVTAQTLNFHERIAMQAVWQKHIDASISSTVNVPNSFTVEDTLNLYMEAWKNGLKGVTIFRDGCKRTGILMTDKSNEHEHEVQPLPRGFIIPKSDDLVGKLRTLTTGCGSLHVTAFFDPFTGDFVHAFLSKGSTGGCANFMVGLSRMISLAARGGISLDDIVDQLNSCGSCSSYAVRSATKHDTSKGSCCPMAIGNALIDMHNEMLRDIGADESEDKPEPKPVPKPMQKLNKKNPCPSCGEELVFEGGCNSCKSCGWSKCS